MRLTTSDQITSCPAVSAKGIHASWPELQKAAAALIQPAPVLITIACALMLLACNVNEHIGHRFVTFKHFYVHAFLLCIVLAATYRSAALSRAAWSDMAARAGAALCWFLPFCLLIGGGALVSNGTAYQTMATNFWGTDLFQSTSRRIALPALANVLGFESHGYVYFWYIVLFASFAAAVSYLKTYALRRIEIFSILTSTIFAYSLIGPGYNEIFVVLLGLAALQVRLGLCAKLLVATLMIATHETATPFVAGVVVLSAEREDRAEWLLAFGSLYVFYVAAYIFTWREDVLAALTRAGRPSAESGDDSVSLALHHPCGVIFGIFAAYKLYWMVVAIGLARPRTRAMAVAACAPIVLAIIGTDTSRLVEFGSLALLAVAGAVLPTLDGRTRTLLASANLVVPSLYIASNVLIDDRVVPLWGRGLYSLYYRASQAMGLEWGGLFLP